ncbi:hypothetical protein [Haliscomenobacter hydrossis]|uniref:Uncharacterized protein n=1 Tax=Haliscomenobacter hydrossis (strain ATCC 27775 / DSM 1100 / LMG 10767 / O) TaxID=760192 RepID=F4KQ80_HALH1|nr:hypothetical protein [Haliscomenobacter hydrossis]AEE54241.1 hypothetical protein Halhy_6423 [Haliscomenobacter hydrossis DSM 1100]
MNATMGLMGKILMAIILLSACNCTGRKNSGPAQIDQTLTSSLVEQQIGESNFYIALPTGYFMKETKGLDFSVYYIAATDTTASGNFTAGLYFGDYPSEFQPDSDDCTSETRKGKILNVSKDWTLYNCNGQYTIQTIVDNESGAEGNKRIHAFGRVSKQTELDRILEIFATLVKK